MKRVTRAFPRGHVLFREGDVGQEMYVISSGRVRLSRRIRDVEKALTTLPAGEFFGELALLNRSPRSATAEVVEDAELVVVGPEHFDALLGERREMALRLIQRLAGRLQEANRDVTLLMYRDSRSRVAHALVRFQGPDLHVDRLGPRIGLRPEELSEVLQALERRGICRERADGEIALLDRARLARFLDYLELRHEFE